LNTERVVNTNKMKPMITYLSKTLHASAIIRALILFIAWLAVWQSGSLGDWSNTPNMPVFGSLLQVLLLHVCWY
jgi:hypothetical protein